MFVCSTGFYPFGLFMASLNIWPIWSLFCVSSLETAGFMTWPVMNPAAVLRQGNAKCKPKAALVQEEKEVLFLCCLCGRYSPILFLACLNLKPLS